MGINDILAAIDNMKRVGGRNITDLGRDPMGALSKIAANVKEQLGTEEGAKEFMYNSMTPGVGGIIKSKGGNWLTGSVENALSGLKRRVSPTLQEDMVRAGHPWTAAEEAGLGQTMALNNWIEGPLTKYVKRDMATEGDPVRKLAEQGVLHFTPEPGFNSVLYGRRQNQGFAPMGVGKTPFAQSWEGMADSFVIPREALWHKGVTKDLASNPWLADLAGASKVNSASTSVRPRELGFNHLTDELSNALNPESGLPRHLQLTPEQMQQLGMEKAVRHVADINAWRAAQQAEANLAKSQSPAVRMVREYSENNPKGLRWVEIKQPVNRSSAITDNQLSDVYGEVETKLLEDPKMVKRYEKYMNDEDLDSWDSFVRTKAEEYLASTPEQVDSATARTMLQEQLKYEGDTMGHCVGRYCDDVASGKSRIFSLRDAKGEPHVTIETAPSTYSKYGGEPLDVNDPNQFSSIIQIKGKQNKKPNDEYLPFVQDFVRNHPEGGKWGDVGDIQNTGLRRTADVFNPNELAQYQKAGIDIHPEWLTEGEIPGLHDAYPKQGNFEPLDFDGGRGYILR